MDDSGVFDAGQTDHDKAVGTFSPVNNLLDIITSSICIF